MEKAGGTLPGAPNNGASKGPADVLHVAAEEELPAIQVHTCMHARKGTRDYVHTIFAWCTATDAHIHTYIHTYIHIYIHTYTACHIPLHGSTDALDRDKRVACLLP
jgi:hypothetical protein